jgi:hypothetical protein
VIDDDGYGDDDHGDDINGNDDGRDRTLMASAMMMKRLCICDIDDED